MRRWLELCVGLACVCAACGAEAPPSPPIAAPAKAAVREADLAGIGLDAEQERRLGIETAPAAFARLPRRRLFAGDVVVALGGSDDASERRGGADASHPLLPPQTSADLERVADQQLAADAAVEAARIALAAAQRALTREQGLLDAKAGSGRALDAARAQQELAQAALWSAARRRQLLGDPVFEALASGRRLVRVAVYAGELARIDADAEAALAPLGAPESEATRALRPVRISVSSTPAPATTDLYYAPLEVRPELRPGERVAVFLPLRGEVESVVVPRSAVLRDIHGGAWVYEQTASHRFVRRRVQVSETLGDRVALASGPEPGAAIVTAGAAELFGAELGFAK